MYDEIKLLKNNDKRTDSDLEKIDEFYNFLQGEIPEGIRLGRGHKPILSKKKAMAVIWYLQEHLAIFPDHIEQCSVCGTLYDSWSSGIYWESKGKCFCDSCSYLVPENYDRGKR